MKAQYEHIANTRSASFSVEKFDKNRICNHEGLHFHNGYEIVFIKNGRGKIIVENECQEYENGALIFLGPCLPHFSFSNYTLEDNFEIVIHFDEVFIEKRLKQIPEFLQMLPFINKSKKVIIFNLEFKERQASVFEQLVCLSPLEQLATVFNILCRLSTTSEYQLLLNKSINNKIIYNQKIEHIFEYINEHYATAISTKDIAHHLNLTTNSFCKLFKKLTGKSFITYLNEYRIHRAVHLIENSNDNISEIAYQCGFENLSYFSKVFFRVKNITPVDYRKHYHQKFFKLNSVSLNLDNGS